MSQHREEAGPAAPSWAGDGSRRAFGLRSLLLLVVAAAADAVPTHLALLEAADDSVEAASSLRSPSGRTASPDVRAAAALGLIAPGTPREAEAAEAMLAALARPPEDLAVRATLALAVSRFTPPFARRAVPGLASALQEAARSRNLFGLRGEVAAICEALSRLAPGSPAEAEAMDALSSALEIPWGDAPDAAARALAAIGPGARSGLPALRRLSRGPTDSNQTAYRAASEAVRIIAGGSDRLEERRGRVKILRGIDGPSPGAPS